ncbi:MAG: flavodoxin domain-containing protein [Actinomadura sp.]
MVVLVGYASAHGSTREIAERIAAMLGKHGTRAEARSVDQVQNAADYDVFVLGSAVHSGAWLREATVFVRRNLSVLADRPVWLFSVGARDARIGARRGWPAVYQKEPKEIIGLCEAIHPRDHHVFSGAIERDHLPLVGRLIFKGMGGRYGDFRDWKQIDAWAEDIARDLAAGTHERG